MKTLCKILVPVALAGVLGCGETTKPGGPGAATPKAAKTAGEKAKEAVGAVPERAFELKLPGSTSVSQGESKTVHVGISRGKNFDQDVKLSFDGVPPGVKLTPASPTLKAGDKSEDVTVAAAKDAALGDHTIKVTGTPATGAATSGEFKVTVKKP